MSEPVTLTVVMRPAHGGDPPPQGVTSETVAQHAPDRGAASRAQRWFADQGFEVAPLVGTAFAITAPAEQARSAFPDLGERPAELALDKLPADVAEHVHAVVAEPPLDFGPTSW